jgi:uncharacterized protein YfaS (alpha-2-macroglobulin family)
MNRRFLFPAAILLIGSALFLVSFQSTGAQTSDSPVATYSHGILHVTIPHASATGQLTVDILDPEDHAIGTYTRQVAGDAAWTADIKLTTPVALDDLVWHRLRYRCGAVSGTESISQILRTPVLRMLGQQSYFSGGQAAVRVIVTDSKNEPVAGRSTLRIELAGQSLFNGPLNQRGTTEAQLRFPAGVTGNQPMHYVVDTPIGSTEVTQQVRLEDKAQILLTTEKPIYQPGQTIHVRALALNRANHEAAAERKLMFEVEDSRGNKVFKKATQTDKFGVASAEFSLADEVNLGTYHLRALMDGAGAPQEMALNVERYVLPKFKVAVELAGMAGLQPPHGYRPGDHVTGTVRANYFFGKAVDGGEITVKATGMDVATFEAGSAAGKTDAEGAYRFDFTLPTYFAGKPLAGGVARVLVEATVKDNAGHSETRGEPITVSESPLLITAIPEGGTLVPNLENQLFVLTSYADGKPAPAEVKVNGETAKTDAGGVAMIPIHAGAMPETVRIEASDGEGNHATNTVRLQMRGGEDQILLRTEHAVYRAGDRIALRILSTKLRGTAYVDVVKDGQTVLTRDLDIVNGEATLAIAATPDLAGTLDFNAYLIGRDARPVGDHRLVFVQPADELKIEATADASTYKPGDDARVRFHVTNGRGEGVQAALGLQVVDEAVFALAEKQPGFAKVFFYLEQEALKPRYEIHSVGMPDVVAGRDLAARALFAATEMVRTNRFETEAGRSAPMGKYGEYRQRYDRQFLALLRRMSPADLHKPTRDAWDNTMRVERSSWNMPQAYTVQSAGPDKRFGTNDDLFTVVQIQNKLIVSPPVLGQGSIDVEVEHDRGPFNGFAEIVGHVVDATAAAVPEADITITGAIAQKRTAKSSADGRFTMSGLPPGRYQIEVSAPGFRLVRRELEVNIRDRAVLLANLAVGEVGEAIVVDVLPRRAWMNAAGGNARLAAGGVGGFVADGNGEFNRLEQFAMLGAAPRAAMLAPPSNGPGSGGGIGTGKAGGVGFGSAPAPRVRSYFPEALYINPEIITDGHGNATISIPLADSITTWRMAMVASTVHGALGSGTSSLKVFQDFFTDLDLPVTLTQGDRVSIPVAVYNYSAGRGDVSLKLQQDEWFALAQDVPEKSLSVEAGRVGGSQFTIEAKRIGKFKLTLTASMRGGARRADIVVREIEVVPNGREQNTVFNGRLDTSVEHAINFPAASIPDASKVFVRLYPGPLSQVIEGMDAILRMPGGCFEQTSSSTYPNVLALDYMKRTKKLTPEVHAKAEGFIANGYQRLLTFEVPGGGFSWFGQAPANKILTSYGLMEFADMAKVYDVDPNLIRRTQQWLASQQQADGSWKPDTQFINEGATNRYNTDPVRIAAYIAWALENTGYQGPAVEKATQFIVSHLSAQSELKLDSYTMAVLANLLVEGKDRNMANQVVDMLVDSRTEKDDQAWWTTEETNMYGRGASAAVETTGLAAQALLKSGRHSAVVTRALAYIASKKDALGTWGTTQATIMALRALLLATEKGSADVRGTVEITLNGQPIEHLTLTADNNDLLHQFALKGIDARANAVGIRFQGTGGLAYQVAGRYFLPWTERPANEPMTIDVTYDRTRLAQDDLATATAVVKNNLPKTANMVMVDLGIPPGFDLLSEDLQTMQEQTANRKGGRLEKFSLTATQAILYFDSIGAGETVKVSYRLRAKYPLRAWSVKSRVYEYYDPEVNSVARPIQLEVRPK